MAKKTNIAKKASVEKKMKAALASALVDEKTIVGHVTAKLGNGGFRVSLKDGKEVQGLIRGVFKGGKNSESFVAPGMYVILAPNASEHIKVHEIVGVINNRKDLKALIEAGLIDEDAKDDLFDHSDESESESDKILKPETDADLDIDAL